MEKIFEILYVIFGSTLLLCFLLVIPYTLIVGQHFDQWFRDKKPIAAYYKPLFFPGYSSFCRAIAYGKCMVLPFLMQNSSERKLLYGDFDFKQHANKFHLILSYVFIYQIVIVTITTALMMTLKAIMWLMKNGIFVTTT